MIEDSAGSPRRSAAAVGCGPTSWATWPRMAAWRGSPGWIFEGSALSSNPLPWVALWMAAGLATLCLWMLAALPLDRWERLVRTQWRPLLFAGLAGIAALVMGRWTSSLWGLFHGSTFWAVRGVLGLFYGDVVCLPEEFVLGTPRFEVEISLRVLRLRGDRPDLGVPGGLLLVVSPRAAVPAGLAADPPGHGAELDRSTCCGSPR